MADKTTMEMIADLEALIKPFESCVQVFDDPKRTEMVLRDCAIVWRSPKHGLDLGYDMETDELVAIRVYGDVSKRQ